jgi:hypothetical protein
MFQAGQPRPPGAGRRPGTPNKAKSELANLLHEKFPGYDPLMAMAEIAQDVEVELSLRITCHKEVAQYLRPKLRSTTVTGTLGVVDLTIGKMPG